MTKALHWQPLRIPPAKLKDTLWTTRHDISADFMRQLSEVYCKPAVSRGRSFATLVRAHRQPRDPPAPSPALCPVE